MLKEIMAPVAARRAGVVLLTSGLLVGATGARASEYCVACYEPDAVYRCIISGGPSGLPADPRHQIACIKELAVSGGHARCSVERFSAVGCDGAIHTIAARAIESPPASVPEAAAEVPSGLPAVTGAPEPGSGRVGAEVGSDVAKDVGQPSPGPQTSEAPQTVEEAAQAASDSAKSGIEKIGDNVASTTRKAGEQIGSAAKKTWDCLSSFFSDC